MNYENTAEELANRIEALIPTNPEILKMDSPWDLFKVPGFKCDDLQPSMAQAAWALGKAQGRAGMRKAFGLAANNGAVDFG